MRTARYRTTVVGTGVPGDHYRLDLPDGMPPGTRFRADPWINGDGTMVASEVDFEVVTDDRGHARLAGHRAVQDAHRRQNARHAGLKAAGE